jgi:small subunit ribosomal protein S1
VLDSVVKNITDYGAFVDLGGVDGLLHITDIAWRRINHPSEALTIGQQVKVQVIRFNPETQRISLGMKQLMADPWDGVAIKYPVSGKFSGRVTNITDYGAFVELEPGVEGLVHVSEMSWTKKNVHPGKIVSTSQEVEVMVLDVDPQKRRISLGLKQCLENPWEAFIEKYPSGTELEGEVRNITEFGLFVGLPGDIDGMVHLSDIDWSRPGETAIQDFRKGDQVKVKVLDVDIDKERISLGIKQLESDPFESALGRMTKGQVVTCTVIGVQEGGLDVTMSDGVPGFVRKSELSRERSEQRARPLRRRREGRCQGDQHRPRDPQGDAVDQGPRARRGEARDGGVRLVRLRRQPRRHPGGGHEPRPPGPREDRRVAGRGRPPPAAARCPFPSLRSD